MTLCAVVDSGVLRRLPQRHVECVERLIRVLLPVDQVDEVACYVPLVANVCPKLRDDLVCGVLRVLFDLEDVGQGLLHLWR